MRLKSSVSYHAVALTVVLSFMATLSLGSSADVQVSESSLQMRRDNGLAVLESYSDTATGDAADDDSGDDSGDEYCDDFESAADKCEYAQKCPPEEFFLNYLEFHYCYMESAAAISVILLALWLILLLYILGNTAEDYFCVVLEDMTDCFNLSPNIAGVTLLAFGNGAPDVFGGISSREKPELLFTAITGAGIFVTCVVAGAVAMAAPTKVNRRPFLRDVLFYMASAGGLYGIYFDMSIHLSEAIGFVLFYCVYVIIVMVGRLVYQRRRRLRLKRRQERMRARMEERSQTLSRTDTFSSVASEDEEERFDYVVFEDFLKERALLHPEIVPRMRSASHDHAMRQRQNSTGNAGDDAPGERVLNTMLSQTQSFNIESAIMPRFRSNSLPHAALERPLMAEEFDLEEERSDSVSCMDRSLEYFGKVVWVLESPFLLARNISIPLVYDDKWNKKQAAVCIVFSLPFIGIALSLADQLINGVFPWMVLIVMVSLVLAGIFWVTSSEDYPMYQIPLLLLSFAMSVVWIYLIANELVGVLTSVGQISGLSDAILGVTVLALGNSIGDLVSNVAVARAGHPDMAIAGCYAGPLFNMLFGMGISLILSAIDSNPVKIEHHGLAVHAALLFLLISLFSTSVIVPLNKFTFPRWYAGAMIVWYVLFLVVSVLIEASVIPEDGFCSVFPNLESCG